jgi:hypothetical protein
LSEDSCVINEFGSYIEINMYKVAVISLMQCKKVLMKCDLFREMKEHSRDFKIVMVLQNCMDLIKDEPDSGSEANETNLEDRSEEGNITDEDANMKIEAEIKFEEFEDIKEENPEVLTSPAIKPEPEVSVWGLCISQQCFMLPRPFTATKREIMKIHFNYPYVCTSHWLWAGLSGDQIPVGARFSAPVQIGPGAHPASCTMGTGSVLGVKSSQGVTLTPHPLLVPLVMEE